MLAGEARQESQQGRLERGMDDVLWLAGRDIARSRHAYPVSAVYLGGLSLLLVASDGIEIGTFSFEFVMLVMLMILATPFLAREYISWSTDPVAVRLGWLRTLPIGVPTIVRSRMLSIVAAIPLNMLAFFGPIYVADAWGVGGARFAWLVIALIGLSLLGAGVTLCLEMSIGLRRWYMVSLATLVIACALLLALGLSVDIWPFERLTRVLAWNGPLVATLCVVAGVSGFLVLGRLAERLLARRELST